MYNGSSEMDYTIYKSEEYEEWYDGETAKSQVQIEKRLSNVEFHGHFGIHKSVGECVWELKWRNSRRLYYAYLEEENLLLLLGGNKNGQNEDIKRARRILKNNTEGS